MKVAKVVMQTDNNWSFDDLISGWNTSTQEDEWLEIVPDNPAEFICCIGELPEDAEANGFGCTGVDELIRFNNTLYIVQSIDLDDYSEEGVGLGLSA